jgi:hypothetical protein
VSAAEVLVVAEPGDQHGDLIVEILKDRAVNVFRVSLPSLRADRLVWTAGSSLRLVLGGQSVSVRPSTCVWWRRPGWVVDPDMDPLEAALADDEAHIMLPGALTCAGVRWVDDPWNLPRASNRLIQIELARHLRIDAPETLVTNDRKEALAFLTGGEVVVKPISTGFGLAPFVQAADETLLELASGGPTFISAPGGRRR